MPETQTQERPSEGQGWWGSLKDSFSWAASNVGAAVGLVEDADNKMNNARLSDTPGTDLMNYMATQEGFKPGQDGNANLAKIQNDPQFMAALNSALKSDTSILPRLAAAGKNGQGGMGLNELISTLADDTKRGVTTQVLGKIGEDANDGFGADYLAQFVTTAKEENYAEMDALLQQGGINNTSVKMGAMLGPLAKVGNFLRDPNGATKDWINDPNGPFAGLSEDNKNMVAGFVQAFAKFFGMYTGPNGFASEYIEFGKRLGGELAANGASVRGVPNLPSPPSPDGNTGGLMGAAGNPRTGTSLAAAFNPGGLNQRPAAEPDADTPAPQVARVEHRERGVSAGGVALG